METLLQYVMPAIIGALAAVMGVWLTGRVQRRKIDNDTGASLRGDLMKERKELIAEIRELSKRCDALERANLEQAKEMLELRQHNLDLKNEIKSFRDSR